jgi:transmembrane sensor
MPPVEDAASPSALQAEAFIWLGRLADGQVTRPELQAFKRWQRASPAHEAAFEDAKRQWKSMKPAMTELLHANPALATRHEALIGGRGGLHPGRRAFLRTAAGAAVVAGVAGVAIVRPPLGLWPSQSEWSADYRTATGEQRAIALADRVSLTLNTQTSVRRQTAPGGETTGIDLIAGEAAVDLPDQARSFSVTAGAGRSLSDAGRFEVRYLDERVCVTCVKGTVRVEHAAGVRVLQASQQTVYDGRSISGIAAVDAADVAAWRKGVLVFNQTPLAQVVGEINRYRPGRVVLLASSGRERPVVGRFPIAVLDEALLQIQHAFDLHARSLPGGVLILS